MKVRGCANRAMFGSLFPPLIRRYAPPTNETGPFTSGDVAALVRR